MTCFLKCYWRIRTVSIKFTSNQERLRHVKEQNIIQRISEIERNEHNPEQPNILRDLKLDLMSLRESK